MVNQVLAHVSNTPFKLIEWCNEHDILVEAYSPMGHGELMKNTQLKEIAFCHAVSTAQLCIRYCLQLGLLPLPKATSEAHLKNNADVGFEISDADIQTLMDMKRIEDYGEFSTLTVYGGRPDEQGRMVGGKPHDE